MHIRWAAMSEDARQQIYEWLAHMADSKEINVDDSETEDVEEEYANGVDENVEEESPIVPSSLPTSLIGEGELTFATGDYFRGEFTGSVHDREGELVRVATACGAVTTGRWRNGRLEGRVVVGGADGGWTVALYRRGKKHGLAREFGPARARDDNLKMVARYNNGQVCEPTWQGLTGGAFLVGPTDDNGRVSGDSCIYLYPDLSTAMIGSFAAGNLVSGRMGTVVGVSIKDGILLPDVKVDEASAQTFTRDVSTSSRMSSQPLLQDPFEAKRVRARVSRLTDPNAGEGLFAIRDLPNGGIVALYNGVRNRSSRDDALSDYRVRLNGELSIDIPQDMSSVTSYCATLAHKANHSFAPNARLVQLEHPRFGLIVAIRAARDIKEDEEILVNYGMKLSFAPQWYRSLWVQHCRHDKGMSDQDIRDWAGRQYSMHGRHVDLDGAM